MSEAIKELMNEHEAILFALKVLERMSSMLDEGRELPAEDVGNMVGFLKEFADRCHHGKEEGILFERLVRYGMSREAGPVGVMLGEHMRGRALIAEMAQAIAGSHVDAGRFTAGARGYIDLLRAHIDKENNVLFPMAEKVIPEKEMAEIYRGFEEHEEKVIGAGRHEELHRMLDALEKTYGTTG